jgi:hypothetical protein
MKHNQAFIEELCVKIEEFKQQKTGLSDDIAKTIVDAKINTLRWAVRQAMKYTKK